jgi:hypothetical protein
VKYRLLKDHLFGTVIRRKGEIVEFDPSNAPIPSLHMEPLDEGAKTRQQAYSKDAFPTRMKHWGMTGR